MSEELERSGSEQVEETLIAAEAAVEEKQQSVQPDGEVEQAVPENIPYAEYEALKKEKEELERQKTDKSEYITNLMKEQALKDAKISELEKSIQSEKALLPDEEDVWTGHDVTRKMGVDRRQEELNALALEKTIAHNQLMINSSIPGYEEMVPRIAEEMKKNGVSASLAEQYKENPYRFQAEDMSYIMATANSVMKDLEIERLKAGATSVTDHVKKVEEAARVGTLSNSTGTSSTEKSTEISITDVWNLPAGQAAKLFNDRTKLK